MKSIGDLFAKIRNTQTRRANQLTAIQDSIQKSANLTVSLSDISIKNNVVYLKNLSQSAKTQLFLRKQSVIESLVPVMDQLGLKISDIRAY